MQTEMTEFPNNGTLKDDIRAKYSSFIAVYLNISRPSNIRKENSHAIWQHLHCNN
jgi:hypothetical protein